VLEVYFLGKVDEKEQGKKGRADNQKETEFLIGRKGKSTHMGWLELKLS